MWDRLSKSSMHEYRDHLLALSDDDRFLRFAGHTSDTEIARYVGGISRDDDVLVYREGGIVVAACHIARLRQGHVEIGLSVLSTYRGQGIGTRLLTRAVALAKMRQAKQISLVCLSKNIWVVRKVTSLDMTKEYDGGDCHATGMYSGPSIDDYNQIIDQYINEIASVNYMISSTMVKIARTIAFMNQIPES